MRNLIILGVFFLSSCGSNPVETVTEFRRLIPDTTKSWSGRMSRDYYHFTRQLEQKLNLPSLLNGTKNQEFRVWNLSNAYDPLDLFILKEDSIDKWTLRTLSFYHANGDSIGTDYTRLVRQDFIDSMNLSNFWSLGSQSDLRDGDSYGCFDGGDVFMEIADSARYRFMWYRCPDLNKHKDSVFLLSSMLVIKLDELTEGR